MLALMRNDWRLWDVVLVEDDFRVIAGGYRSVEEAEVASWDYDEHGQLI